jgi:hypothetical protein
MPSPTTRAVAALIEELDAPPTPIRLVPEPTPLETLAARVAQLEQRLDDETASRRFIDELLTRATRELKARMEAG